MLSGLRDELALGGSLIHKILIFILHIKALPIQITRRLKNGPNKPQCRPNDQRSCLTIFPQNQAARAFRVQFVCRHTIKAKYQH